MAALPRLVHVVFRTAQVNAMREWYRTVLNARVVHADSGLMFLPSSFGDNPDRWRA